MNLVAHIPNGVLIIFNSTGTFELCRNQWTVSKKNILTSLSQLKYLVYEPTNSADVGAVLDMYTNKAKTPKGAILFAVCRVTIRGSHHAGWLNEWLTAGKDRRGY